ncbi:MAG: hypothetical protein HZB62_13800 [Nitrospirae bacterium]|nr:hypothetical protein [Nitrospirota bacterium]
MKKDYYLYLVAITFGAAIWYFIAAASGRREAWDSGLYFTMGMPAVCLISFALGFFAPVRSWRWGIAPLFGQFIWMLLTQGVGNLLPLGIIVFAVLSVPSVLAALFGGFLGARKAQH